MTKPSLSPLEQLRKLRDGFACGFDANKRRRVEHDDALVSCKFVVDELSKIIRRIESDISKVKKASKP